MPPLILPIGGSPLNPVSREGKQADISLQHSIILESAIAYLIQAIEDIFDK
jgi:hypothetical protein